MTIHSITTSDSPWQIDGSSTWKGNSIVAGDTFEVSNGTYAGRLRFRNLPGASGNVITIINDGGQVILQGDSSWAISFEDCTYVNLRGDGDVGFTYGFQVEHKVMIHENNENFEVSYIHRTSDNVGAIGFHCTQRAAGASERIIGIEYHHCKVDSLNSEAFYIGNADYASSSTDYELLDIIVRNCIIDGCYDGIQLRGVLASNPGYVYDNVITNGTTPDSGPYRAMLLMGRGAHVQVYRNTVIDTRGHGLFFSTGQRDNTYISRFYNNLLVRCGDGGTTSNHAIRIQQGANYDGNIEILYNTLVTNGNGGDGEGIHVGTFSGDVLVAGNIILDTAAGDAIDGVAGGDMRDNLTDTAADSEDSTAYSIADMDFVNAAGDDYHLESSSPAVDFGDVADAPADDLDGVTRDANPDVGCYEFVSGDGDFSTLLGMIITEGLGGV